MSPDQINAVVPSRLAPGGRASVRIVAATGAAAQLQGVVLPARLGIFGIGSKALNQDGTPNAATNPARFGSIVSIWLTGVGTIFSGSDGQVQTIAQDYRCCTVRVQDKTAEVLYAAAAPGVVTGVFQVNFRVPADLAPGLRSPAFSVSVIPPSSSQPVTVADSIAAVP